MSVQFDTKILLRSLHMEKDVLLCLLFLQPHILHLNSSYSRRISGIKRLWILIIKKKYHRNKNKTFTLYLEINMFAVDIFYCSNLLLGCNVTLMCFIFVHFYSLRVTAEKNYFLGLNTFLWLIAETGYWN